MMQDNELKVLYVDAMGKATKDPVVQYYYYDGTQLAGMDAKGNIVRQYIIQEIACWQYRLSKRNRTYH